MPDVSKIKGLNGTTYDIKDITARNTADSKSNKGIAFSVTLTVSGWDDYTQAISDARFIVSGYAYFVAPESSSYTDYSDARIYADDVTVAGEMTFHCSETPEDAITVNIVRTEVQ